VEPSQRNDGGTDGERWRAAGDALLLAAVARGVDPAITEFYHRFSDVLIAIARRHGVAKAERVSRVAEFLDDTVLRLSERRHPVPRSLVAYLATSFRHRLGMDWRAETREGHRYDATLSEVADGSQRVVAEICSEYAVRTATSADDSAVEDERGLPNQARTELSDALWKAMSAEERQMMGYLAERHPQREIAGYLGLTPEATRVRILRLRRRMQVVAARYVATLPVDEGVALSRMLEARQSHVTERPASPPADGVRRQARNGQPKKGQAPDKHGPRPRGNSHE
jgi:RNA polymerase sigma factor (sigma-70 family)